MATITNLDATQKAAFVADQQTLSAADVITFEAQKKQLLVLNNNTGGALTATIDGNAGTTVNVDGIGSVDVSAGLAIAVPAGASRAVVLSTIKSYLQGVVNVTGGTGLKVQIFNL